MRKMKKVMFASLAMAVAFGGGMLATNFANADETNVLDALKMEDGMSIRMNTPEGLRFQATVAMSDAEYAESGITEIGTVLMPESAVTGELTVDESKGGATALCIPTENWIVESDENSKSYYSVLVAGDMESEFPETFYNTPISARAYAKYADGSVKYSANTVTRSIGYVAAMYYMTGATDTIVAKIASKTNLSVDVNGGAELTTKNTDGYVANLVVGGVVAEDYEDVSVVWSVEGDAVSVNAETGVVTPVQAGTATVTATIGGQIPVSTTVTVTAPEVKLTMGNQVALVGQAVAPVATVTVDGEPVEATLTLTSGNDSLFTVADGKMTGVAHGETTVTATYEGVSAQAKVTVFDKAIYDTSDFLAITGDSWYILANNIDFNDVSYTTISSFSGLLDGNGYAVKNISIYVTGDDVWGTKAMFSTMAGTIRRLAIENINLVGYANVAIFQNSLVALYLQGTLEDVYLGGTINAPVEGVMPWGQSYVGWGLRSGVVAYNSNGGVLKDVIVDVQCVNNTGIMGIATGTVTYGVVSVMTGKGVSGAWHDNFAYLEINQTGEWDIATCSRHVWPAFNIDGMVWDVQVDVMAKLIQNVTGVVPAKA